MIIPDREVDIMKLAAQAKLRRYKEEFMRVKLGERAEWQEQINTPQKPEMTGQKLPADTGLIPTV